MRADIYQTVLIISLVICAVLGGIFYFDEVYPQYKIFQNDYVELEEFRSSYTGESPPPFKFGVKQIVLLREDKGPEIIDRCNSCHVALIFPHFSPTKVALDSNGKPKVDENGKPILVPNENYIWLKLDEKIASLRDEKFNQDLLKEGKDSIVKDRLKRADYLASLKTKEIDGRTIDMTKVLSMHPLIGNETRPFEYHPEELYGCTSCHNGNGRGLVIDKAHGPVFDEEYEPEHTGFEPIFTEPDPKNDPKFARVFNHKPNHNLLFQTTPLFVGNVIEAKCVQCHQANTKALERILNHEEALPQKNDELETYHRGQQLYISQACYACHRITSFARGGVGPELTKSGFSYPWYIKESIVWPQADLKTSAMPNFKLDHQEVEALVTFVLGQTGQNKSISDFDYQSRAKEWEAGSKQLWEKPLPPDKIHDVRNSMIIFASEGCASCHRLRGFESDVGFKIESEQEKPDFDALYKERQWFTTLFPEEIIGSKIVENIEKHLEEIDSKIVDHVRHDSILEEIEKIDPGLIESFYSNFQYAFRAKNSDYQSQELELWKKRVKRVLKMYIQEYGLGRLICPRLNWSGVFRSDKWLMEHFFNPTSETPKSIMPVFPFDESKFYALTYMLDALAKKNRNEDLLIWKNRGFNPEIAFEMYCSQCHGEHKRGNGPVSEWIYPIPKNLTNSIFLRSLTKERAIQSITHGVKGTPMPPWGEVAYKNDDDQVPILNQKQIEQIVDWLFFDLSGNQTIEDQKDVLKWQYAPEDVIKELRKEGGKIKSLKNEKDSKTPLSLIPELTNFYAALKPEVHMSEESSEIATLFDIQPPIVPGPESHSYYIKKQYYTEANLKEGKQLFIENCASCHGTEADGTGLRAEAMLEAKPRMLTNLNWLSTRDDLRLLRSIKYGVPGTAMTPWGDMTSTEQRIQLVMYIRSLSQEQNTRTQLYNALYDTFEETALTVENARGKEYKEIQQIESKIKQLDLEQEAFKIEEKDSLEARVKAFEQQLQLEKTLKEKKEVDKILLNLKNEIEHESEYYKNIGVSFIAAKVSDSDFRSFLKLIELHKQLFKYKDNQLLMQKNQEESTFDDLYNRLIKEIESKIERLTKEKVLIEAKIDSSYKKAELIQVSNELKTYEKVKDSLITNLTEAKKSVQLQEKLYNEFQEKIKTKT